MILSIDESGDFKPDSEKQNFYVCAHIRQDNDKYNNKLNQFIKWEKNIPICYKSSNGEIKSSNLPDNILEDFIVNIIVTEPIIGITPVSVITNLNPVKVIEKHKSLQLAGINQGVLGYKKIGRNKLASMYSQFANWYRKINYSQFIKIHLLGLCMYKSLKNAIIHSIIDGYDHDLINLKFYIDRIFIKGLEQNSFWHEIIRNQGYEYSIKDPLPCLTDWRECNHPFYKKYIRGDYYELNELYWENTSFMESFKYFEIRIADTICTILNRRWNYGKLLESYKLLAKAFNADRTIESMILKDFNFEYKIGLIKSSPWDD
jgi:hypothetical protein